MSFIIQKLRRFAQDGQGSVMAETVIVLPVLLWSYLALFVYWDAFRSTNEVQKATYTISDIISREMETKPQAYFNGLRDVAEFLVDTDQDVKMRITSITYDEDDERFEVLWSYSPDNTMPVLTTATLQDYKARIPDMNDADFATIVETEVDYVPAFNVGLSEQTMQQFILTRPRFVAPNCLSGAICNPV